MSLRYPPQPYFVYSQPQWPEDVKPALTEDDSSVLDDKVLDSSTPADMNSVSASISQSRRASTTKIEDDYSATTSNWSGRPHGSMPTPARTFSHPTIPMASPSSQFFGQVNGANCTTNYMANQWGLATRSEASTPTQFFNSSESFGQQAQYQSGPVQFPAFGQQDPVSAVSMSPQSSQGGWASTTSSDAAENYSGERHPRFRAASPILVLRSDGIRKKNAKFEIPKERNLANIDALIMQTTNEEEKKELKQQKRLLRNRQAALDSRQRKKTHTEKLEQEKKIFSSQKAEMEDTIAQLESTLQHEREQWMAQRQHYDHFIQTLQYDRDEAIRAKTVETGELRRMNNILKDTIRDLERQQSVRSYSSNAADAFSSEFTNFRLDEDTWDDEFGLIPSDDLKMEENDALQRQATPRPTTTSTQPPQPPTSKDDVKVDAGFSWNTFYMCLLSGAFLVSQAGQAGSAVSNTTALPPNIPSLSEDYRTEAGQVLSAVLASRPESAHEILTTHPASTVDTSFPATVSGSELSRMGPQQAPGSSASTLDAMHSALTTPSRQQEVSQAFSLSTASYNHIANADGIFDNEEPVEAKPTRLEQLFASMQAERDGIDKMSGISSKARERSVLLDRVPEKVLRDFRELIAAQNA